jgi:hypothetical protein
MTTTTRRLGATALAAVMITGLAAAPAMARDGDGRVIKRGGCSASTDWKLKAKPDDGGLEVEFEVDSNRSGQRWTWSIRHDGDVVASGRRTTQPPSGSFSVERRVADASGTHTVSATARNLRTGETCRASLQI